MSTCLAEESGVSTVAENEKRCSTRRSGKTRAKQKKGSERTVPRKRHRCALGFFGKSWRSGPLNVKAFAFPLALFAPMGRDTLGHDMAPEPTLTPNWASLNPIWGPGILKAERASHGHCCIVEETIVPPTCPPGRSADRSATEQWMRYYTFL